MMKNTWSIISIIMIKSNLFICLFHLIWNLMLLMLLKIKLCHI